MSDLNLCKYKDIFGKPNEGVHKYRFYNIAVVDFIMTIIFALIISIIFDTGMIKTTIILFLLGCIMHYIFCVDTTINLYLKKVLNCINS
jgi:hypothetical protein